MTRTRPADPVLAALEELRERFNDLNLGGRFSKATYDALRSASFAVDRARKEDTRMAQTDDAIGREVLKGLIAFLSDFVAGAADAECLTEEGKVTYQARMQELADKADRIDRPRGRAGKEAT